MRWDTVQVLNQAADLQICLLATDTQKYSACLLGLKWTCFLCVHRTQHYSTAIDMPCSHTVGILGLLCSTSIGVQ